MNKQKASDSHKSRLPRVHKLYSVFLVMLITSSLLAWSQYRDLNQIEVWQFFTGFVTIILANLYLSAASLFLSEYLFDFDIYWERYVAENEIEKLYGEECQGAEALSREVILEWQAGR
jgi:hypothetical protein